MARRCLLFLLLTLITQVGGLVYLLSYAWNWIFDRQNWTPWAKVLGKSGSYVLAYLLISLLVVPPIASRFGRVPLPWRGEHLRAVSVFTCLLNRHYVRPELKYLVERAAMKLHVGKDSGRLSYLDAGFPFWDGFPLLPHLSHNDGKKLDLAFCYLDPISNKVLEGSPSLIGYGVPSGPLKKEHDQVAECKAAGQWQYAIMKSLVPQWHQYDFVFDRERNAKLLLMLAAEPEVRRIFIEPHLLNRVGLSGPKFKYHGCHSASHDDHIHVEVR